MYCSDSNTGENLVSFARLGLEEYGLCVNIVPLRYADRGAFGRRFASLKIKE